MKCMVIENFRPDKTDAVYKRFNDKGRMLPDGLQYLNSWRSIDGQKCFQLMEADKIELFDAWISHWNDLIDFEIIPVEDSPTKTVQQAGAPDTLQAPVTLDGNVGTIAVGDIVTGTGITGATSGVVRVATVTSQTNIALDTAVSLSDDTVLTFDGSNILFVGALDASKSVAAGDIFRINAGNLSIELK